MDVLRKIITDPRIKKLGLLANNIYRAHRETILASGVILVIILFANSYYLLGFANPNPLQQRSGLGVSQENSVLRGLNTIDPNDAFTTQSLGHHSATEWLRGDVPYWNYYEGVGTPLAGEMQSGALSPFVLLFSFSNGNLLFQIVMEIIAGIATYLFLRRLGVRWSVATIGGIAFALNGTHAWLHNAVFNPVAFLPLLLLGVELALSQSKGSKKGGWILMAVALALSLYSGFPETAFINAILVAIWALYRLFTLKKSLRKPFFWKLCTGTTVGLLLAAPILIAFVGYLPYADVGWHGGGIGDASLGYIGIPALVLPYVYGTIFGQIGWSTTTDLAAFWGSVGGYYPVTLLFFALLGLLSKFPRGMKMLLVGWISVCLLKTFGVDIISDVVNLIPTIKNAAFYRYAPPSIAFALVILAALGIESLLRNEIKHKKVVMVAGVTLCIIGILALMAKGEVSKFSTSPGYEIWAVGSVLGAAGLIVLLLITKWVVQKKFLAICFFTLITIEVVLMFMVPQFSTPKITIDMGPINFLKQNSGLNRFHTLGPIEPNYGSYFEVASINQNDLPVPKNWSKYLEKELDTNTSALTFTGAYRTDPKGPSSKEEFFRNIENYRYVGVKYLVATKNTVTVNEAEKNGLHKAYSSQSFEIFELSKVSPYYVDVSSKCTTQGTQLRDTLSLHCPKSTQIIRKELYMPGWKARVNGDAVAIDKDQGLFQKIEVPAGSSKVRFSYLPPFMEIGYIAFLIAVSAIVVSRITPKRNELIDKIQRKLP